MADIDLVIKIPEELYKTYKGRSPRLGDAGMDMIAQAIANGTPLTKGHGRLIDADELLEHAWRDRLDSRERIAEMIKNMPPIIPADKEKQMIRCGDKTCEYNIDGVCRREEART